MSTFSDIIPALHKLGNFSGNEVDQFIACTQQITLKKGEKFLLSGQVCKQLSFLESGAILHRKPLENGGDQILQLGLPGDWILNHTSFTQQQPSEFELEAYNKSQLRYIEIEQLHELIGESPSFFQLGRILDASNPFSHHSIVNLNPRQRYELVLQHKPELLQTYPLKLIAALLEITPETLSRVRKKVSN